MKNMFVLMVSLGLFGWAGAANAQDVINPDRPGFGDGTQVVGKGRFQLEMGLQYERDTQMGVKMHTLSTPLVYRIGINEEWEWRLSTDGVIRQRTTGQDGQRVENGVGDTGLGFKWRVMQGSDEHGTPDVAIIGEIDFASGGKTFRGDGSRPTLTAVAEWELSEETSVGLLVGVYAEKNTVGKKYTGAMTGVSISHSLSQNWGTFLDIAGEKLMSKKKGDSVVTIGTGLTYLLNKDAQIDFSVVKGISHAAPKLQAGVGVSVRF